MKPKKQVSLEKKLHLTWQQNSWKDFSSPEEEHLCFYSYYENCFQDFPTFKGDKVYNGHGGATAWKLTNSAQKLHSKQNHQGIPDQVTLMSKCEKSKVIEEPIKGRKISEVFIKISSIFKNDLSMEFLWICQFYILDLS